MKHQTYNFFFLDRDGVISENNFANNPENFRFLPNSLDALTLLNNHASRIFIATNQGGIEAGYLTEKELNTVHTYMNDTITKHNGRIDHIYYCPHLDTECECRKPKPGMIIEALNTYNMRHCCEAECCFIGDHITDWQAALAANIKPIALRSDRYWDQEAYSFLNHHKIPLYNNLYQAVRALT